VVRDEVYLVPLLGRGRHCHPRRGGCLMEVVGSLGGGPWADRSAHVDPVLAQVARAVNDLTSEQARPALAPLIPWLITPERSGLATAAGLAVAVSAAAAAVPFADPRTADRLQVAIGVAAAHFDVDGERAAASARRRRRRHAVGLVRLAATTVAQGSPERRDVGLRCLLVAGIDRHRRAEGLAPLTRWQRTPADCRGSVAVAGRLVAPDGGDSMHLHCSAIVERWPWWLQDSWNQRQSELRASRQPGPAGVIGRGDADGPQVAVGEAAQDEGRDGRRAPSLTRAG
jgi:hypothetical protein